MSKRKFTWDSWDYDGDGEAYIVAKDECPDINELPAWLIKADNLDTESAKDIPNDIKDGWCRFQCRSDWENMNGPHGWYIVTENRNDTMSLYRKKKAGWFAVWIVRKTDWY